jgi:N-sulfoglucosamine sulfohydrolase
MSRLHLALAAVIGLLAYSTALAAEPSKPNLVVFLADDHGRLDSSPYGATDVCTPNLERFAKDGCLFTHAFVASPSCAPSRAAMLTGLMPARNGAEANHTFKKEGVVSLPDVLRKMGYETAAFGKVGHGQTDIAKHGFDHFAAKHTPAFVQAFLDKRDSNAPLAMFVGSAKPHMPWPDNDGYKPADVKLPPTHVDTPETRDFRCRYYTEVTRLDTWLGEMYDLVRKSVGVNTIFVYMSDHGAQWPFGKWNLYDAGIGVPLLVVWPGVIKPGSKSDAMVQSIDLLPTLIEAAGGTVPANIDGRSFATVLRGKSDRHRDRIFVTHTNDGDMNVYPIRGVRTRDFKFILNLHPAYEHTTHIDKALDRDGVVYWKSWEAAVAKDAKAAAIVKRYHQRPQEEFYDLTADPFEQTNLAGDPKHAERLKQLRAELEKWMKDQGDEGKVFGRPRLLP